YDPARYATGGHTLPFDLVASGGADNVWIVECGRRADWGSFRRFVRSIAASSVQVTPLGVDPILGLPRGFDVTYASPSQGAVSFGSTSSLVAAGETRSLGPFPRYLNPWSIAPFDGKTLHVQDGPYGVDLDFGVPSRSVRFGDRDR